MSDLATTTQKVQQEATQYRAPVSESLMQNMGGAINFCLTKLLPVGTVIPSMLSEAQFLAQNGTGDWYLCDGRVATGTLYASVTSQANVPDFRGVFLRGRNFGRSTATGNAAGDSALGTYQGDEYKSHSHSVEVTNIQIDGARIKEGGSEGGSGQEQLGRATTGGSRDATLTGSALASGGAETRPRNVTVNYFIKVN